MTDYPDEMRDAIEEVRREGYKVVSLYAVVDGVLAALLANFAITTLAEGIASTPVGWALVAAAGVLAAAGELAYHLRRPLVERFEAANPEVNEALRTARDAAEAGEETPVAAALYADVVDRLGETSGVRLVNVPRVGVTIVLVLVVAVATIQVSAGGVPAAGPNTTPAGGGAAAAAGATPEPGGLKSGDEVLGDAETVTPGSENLSASISYGGGGDEDDSDRSYETGGLSSESAVQARQAGYAPREGIEDAELIKEYNLRIREDDT